MGPRRTLLYCVVITLLLHVVTYLLNTQRPLQILALGGRHAQIGWLFAAITGVAMILRPQVGGWTDRYGGRTVMLPGAVTLVVTMVAFFFARLIRTGATSGSSSAATLLHSPARARRARYPRTPPAAAASPRARARRTACAPRGSCPRAAR